MNLTQKIKEKKSEFQSSAPDEVQEVPAEMTLISMTPFPLGIDLEEYNSGEVWRLPLVARYIIDQICISFSNGSISCTQPWGR